MASLWSLPFRSSDIGRLAGFRKNTPSKHLPRQEGKLSGFPPLPALATVDSCQRAIASHPFQRFATTGIGAISVRQRYVDRETATGRAGEHGKRSMNHRSQAPCRSRDPPPPEKCSWGRGGGLAAGSVAPLGGRNGKCIAFAFADDLFRHAAKEELLRAVAATRADDDQVGGNLGGERCDGGGD